MSNVTIQKRGKFYQYKFEIARVDEKRKFLSKSGLMLSVMQSNIHLQKQNTILIVDVKYYSFIIQMYFAKHTLHANSRGAKLNCTVVFWFIGGDQKNMIIVVGYVISW